MIKMLAFDLFGVVITEGHMISNVLMPLLPANTKKPVVRKFYNQYTRGDITESAFWQGIGQPANPQLREQFLNSFVLDEDLAHVVDELSKDYRLSILSNLSKDWANVLVDKFQLTQTFAPIIISGEAGYEKPNRRIYEILIEQSRLPAEQIIFIDDRLENLAAAHALGMQTIHYQREDDDCNYQADYRINKLNDILDIFVKPVALPNQETQRQLETAKDKMVMADAFDEPLDDFTAYMP